jgi:hypothetical protein
MLAWMGLYAFAWNDYDNEARPAVEALVHGHLGQFFTLAPVYGGSLLERAPFAAAPDLWGGGELAVYRMLALPCLLAAILLGLWLVRWMRRNGHTRATCAVAVVLITANPLTLLALELGHPDEMLGGVLCVAAVLLAARERSAFSGLALGAAIANKEWAALAIAPVLLAAPGRRILLLSVAGTVSAAILTPFALLGPSGIAANVKSVATPTGAVFQPWQIWWFLGHTSHAAFGVAGSLTAGDRVPPSWIPTISHPLIVALALPLAIGAWRRLSRDRQASGVIQDCAPAAQRSRQGYALLLLSLLLLLRCMLDPWDNIYYPIPFVLAILIWETTRYRRPPLLAIASTLAVWLGHHWLGTIASPDAQAVFFAAWSVPLATALALALYAPGLTAALAQRGKVLGLQREHLLPALGDEH